MGPAPKVPYSKQMSPAMAARWVLVCVLALLCRVTDAYADKRPVAVINLSDADATRALAQALDVELGNHPDLDRLSTDDASALKNFIDDDKIPLENAQTNLRRANEELAQFNFDRAARQALEGQQELLTVTPAVARHLYAELTLVLGLARLGAQDARGAAEAFAQVHRLEPTRTLDPAVYIPEVVAAYTAATTTTLGNGTIAVAGTGTLWIDGVEVGPGPGSFAASAGTHVVWLTGLERETRGATLFVTAGQPVTAAIPDAPATRGEKLQRARTSLAHAADATARAAAMRHVAELVDVHDAVLLSMSNGKVIVQTWRDRAPGFSSLRELGRDKPADILAPLAPAKVVAHFEPPIVIAPIVEHRWYQKTSWRLGLAATIVTGVLAGIVWSQIPDTVRTSRDTHIVTPGQLTR